MAEFVASLTFPALLGFVLIYLGGLIGFSLLTGAFAERMLGKSRRIYDVHVPRGQVAQETIGTLRFIALAVPAFAAMLWYADRTPNNWFHFGVTFAVCWGAFEVFYWGLHRALHTKALFRFHRYHHDSKVTTPMTGYSMSVVESLGWLVGLAVPPLLLAQFMPISVEGWMAYMAYHVSGNVVGHVNVEVLPRFLSKRSNSWMMHPVTYHSLHHARVLNHYGFSTTVMDRVMKTEWPDWSPLLERVCDGTPMTRFSERG
jgi:lathosterol oxidase